MKSFKEIKEFIYDCFLQYDIDSERFFYKYDDNDFPIGTPIFKGRRADNKTIAKLSEILGLEKEEILETNKEAAERLYNKYSYFELREDWKTSLIMRRYDEKDYSRVLLEAIFGEDPIPATRYDYGKITSRLIDHLKEVDKYFPGTHRKNAQMENLTIETETFAIFPRIQKLVDSYLEIVHRVEELFFSALQKDLSKEDINEYNLLVSHFFITDICTTGQHLYYNYIIQNRELFKAEGYKEFFSYGRINNTLEPWKCRQFYNDMPLIKKLLNCFPDARYSMSKFSEQIAMFSCCFNWSDDKEPIIETDGSLNEAADWELDNHAEQLSDWRKSYDIQKTNEELKNDATASNALEKLIRAPKLGGVEIDFPKEYNVWRRLREPQHQEMLFKQMVTRADFRKKFRGGNV